MNKFIFVLKTKSNLAKPLNIELKTILKPELFKTIFENKSDIKIETDNISIFNILQQSRLIDNVQLEICKGVNASSEKNLKMSIKNINFEKYLPFTKADKYKCPIVDTNCFESKMFHTKMVSNMIASHLNRIAFKNTNDKKNENKDKNLESLPKLEAVIYKDKLSIYTNLAVKSLSIHGYKDITKGDSLKENIASAIVLLSGLTNDSFSNKKIIWDPFCGCGTLLIESYLSRVKSNSRDMSQFKYLLDYPHISESKQTAQMLNQLIKQKYNKVLTSNVINNFHIVGSDISSYALKASITNSKKAGIHLNSTEETISSGENPFIFREKINSNMEFLLGEYEKVFPLINKVPLPKQIILLSHLPYLLNNSTEKTKILYKNFGKFLRKNYDSFESVVILIKERDKKDSLNFINISGLKWDILHEMNNEGTPVQLIKLK